MHIRAQVLQDLRLDGFGYPVNGKDTVAARCKTAKVSGLQTITVVNNVCMKDPSPLNYAAMYASIWRHERCHLKLNLDAFPTIPDARKKLETVVRSDTGRFHDAVVNGTGGFQEANEALKQANTIDVPGTTTYKYWSRNDSNSVWFVRSRLDRILAPGC